jgi:hypothetical protein
MAPKNHPFDRTHPPQHRQVVGHKKLLIGSVGRASSTTNIVASTARVGHI